MDPKIDKIDSWTSRCLVGVPLESWITKIVNLVTKMEPQVSKMMILDEQSD